MLGCRRVRVHTLALGVTDNMSVAFKGADIDTQMVCHARHVAATLPGNTIASVKEQLIAKTVQCLYAYRKVSSLSINPL